MNDQTMTGTLFIRLMLRRFICYSGILFVVIVQSCSTTRQHADMILFNGKIITVDSNFSVAEAIAISRGKILATGSNKEILVYKNDSTQAIDLEGRAVVPGLMEGHAHPIQASQSEAFEKIPDLHNISELLQWIRTQASIKKPGEWIIHPKFFITRLSDMRQLTKKELDSAAPDHPVFLNGSFGGMVNSKALELSGMISLKHAGILRNEQTGEALGVIRGSAFGLLAINDKQSLSDNEKLKALEALFRLYNAVGITSVCSGGGSIEEYKTYKRLEETGELTVRIFHNVIVPFDRKTSENDMRDALKHFGYKTGDGDDWVKVGALKAVLDGGVLTGTAYLREGWGEKAKDVYGINHPGYRGELFYTADELTKLVTVATEAGWKFTAHVTGGGGVDTLLSAYENVNHIKPIRSRRFSVIHGNFYTPDAIEKMARLGVYADMQPAWFYKDADLLNAVLGSERIRTFHPYHSMMKAGVIVNGGSDHMVKLDPNSSINPYNPFPAIWSVVTRKTDRGTLFTPEEAVTREQALKMYTINNAYASFEENTKGSLESGKYADLVVLSDDLLTCPVDTIKNITSLLTIVNGRIVHHDSRLTIPADR